MPIYEYLCHNCNKKVSVLLRNTAVEPLCPLCSKGNLTRVLSSFAIHRSIQTIHEESSLPGGGKSPDYYNDPRNIGRDLEKRLQESNIEIPPEIRRSIDEARDGKLPESVKDFDSASPDTAYH